MKDDSFTWGQRSEADVDIWNDSMNNQRLGDTLPPGDGSRCAEDDWPSACMEYRNNDLARRGLESFNAHDDCGTPVKPMYEDQVTYANYGDLKHGYDRRKIR